MDKPRFVKEFDQTFGSRFLSNSERALNTSLNMNTNILKTSLLGESVMDSSFRTTDVTYLNNIIQDCKTQIEEGEEAEAVAKSFKQMTAALSRKYENNFLKNLKPDSKNLLYREASRLFDKEMGSKEFKSKIRRVVNWRLEQLKKESKDYKWNLLKILIMSLIYKNKENRDLFEIIALRELPNDLRQTIWKIFLEDEPIAAEYKKLLIENKILTLSQFDHQISRDTEEFVMKLTKTEEFDGSMIFCMKTVLSYYEKKKDRILADYLYHLAIPLIFCFGSMRILHSKPGEIISCFFSIQKIVFEFDPLVDLVVKHDEAYDALMTDLFMNSLSLIDSEITQKVTQILNLEKPENRRLLVLLVKKFIHSLGFAFLNMRITLFVWDQLFMKVKRNQVEIFICMAISFNCMREGILECQNWDHVVNTYYGNAKDIEFERFYQKYIEVFERMPFYMSVYELPLERKQLILEQRKGKKEEVSEMKEEQIGEKKQNDEDEEYKKEEAIKPIIQKSQKSKAIQPNFISKKGKNEENEELKGFEFNEKEMVKNLLIEEPKKVEPIGILPNIKQMKKNDLLEGFSSKRKKK